MSLTTIIHASLRSPFNAIAKLYDEARPGYPEQLIEDVISLSAIPQHELQRVPKTRQG